LTTQQTYGQRAARSFAWNHFYKLSEFGLLNVYTLIIARHFGPVGSTPYVVYAAAGTTLSLLAAFAVDGVLLRFLPRISEAGEITHETRLPGVQDLNSFVRKLFAFRLFVVLCLISLLLLCVYVFTNLFGSSDTLASVRELAPLLSVFMLAQAITAFSAFSLSGLLRTKAVFISSFVARSSMLVAAVIFLLLVGEFSIRTAIMIHAAGAILNALLLLGNIRHILKPSATNGRITLTDSLRTFLGDVYSFFRRPSSIWALLISPVMLYGLTTWGSDLLGLALGRQSDILMIRALWGEQTPEVGYYNIASLVLLLTEYIFLLGFGGALVSVFSKLAQDDERDSGSEPVQYNRLRRGGAEIVGFQHITLVPLSAFVFMFSLTIVRAIYGNQYDASAPLVQHGILALGVNIVLFNGGLNITTLLAIGKQQLSLKNRFVWAVVIVVANYFLIRSYGALGAMLGTNWINTFACATEWYIARKYVGSVGKFSSGLKISAISIAAAIGIFELMKLIDLRQGPVTELAVAGPLFFLVVFGLFYLFRLPETNVVLTRLKKAFA
jgi:O-antigen/teichoic acid export membrane protein